MYEHGGEIVSALQPGVIVIIERPPPAAEVAYAHYLPDDYTPPTDGTRDLDTLMYTINNLNGFCHVFTSDWVPYAIKNARPYITLNVNVDVRYRVT